MNQNFPTVEKEIENGIDQWRSLLERSSGQKVYFEPQKGEIGEKPDVITIVRRMKRGSVQNLGANVRFEAAGGSRYIQLKICCV